MVTVAIPVLNGGPRLAEVLDAVRGQRLAQEIELLVCDSGSWDGSARAARDAGARVIEIAAGTFHHAATRNLLVGHARGEFVAMLTQDSVPAGHDWLSTLLAGFTADERVGLVYGPYRPRDDCPPLEAQRLHRFFTALSPEGEARIDRLSVGESGAPALIGPERGYFTDANGCIRRSAWETTPFPLVPYAEDHAIAVAMLRAGWAKVYEPRAAVLHSHHYPAWQQLRRSFDDHRGLSEIYGRRTPARIGDLAVQMRGAAGVGARRGGIATALADQALTLLGAGLGARADRVPRGLRRRLSLQRRGSYEPLDWALVGAERGAQRCT